VVRVPGDHVWEQGIQRFGIQGPPEKLAKWSWSWHPYLMILRTAQLLVLRNAQAIIVPGVFLKKLVCSWGIESDKVHVIQNAAPELSVVNNQELLRGILQFDGELIVTVARLVPWKGIQTLIELMPKILLKFPKSKLLIIGGGPDEKKLDYLIGKLELYDSVSMTGRLEHDVTLRYLEAGDVFVLNSMYEGLSHLILEAMVVGTPIVTTKSGGNPEVIKHEKNGLLVSYDRKDELYSALTKILTDKAGAKKLSERARLDVQLYSKEKAVKMIMSVLKT